MPGKSFLSIPPEIRNRIYHYALPDTAPLRLNDFSLAKKRTGCSAINCFYGYRVSVNPHICSRCVDTLLRNLHSKTYQPPLVRTCREIRSEALLMAYSAMTVIIDNVAYERDVGSRFIAEMGAKFLVKQAKKGALRRVFIGAYEFGRAELFAGVLRGHGLVVKIEGLTDEEWTEVFKGSIKDGYRLVIGEGSNDKEVGVKMAVR